jgi:hypothetical protein
MNLPHALHLCGCYGDEPVSWHVDGECRPLATVRYRREQAALEALRREQAERRRLRDAVAMAALRGHVGGA